MRRPILALLCLALAACPTAPKQAEQDAPGPSAPDSSTKSSAKPSTPELSSLEPAAPKQQPEIVRTDLVAEDLPAIPKLEALAATELGSGQFAFPESTDELAPRAAVSLGEGLLLVGQAYLDRRPGTPPQSWRWAGFVPSGGGEPRSTLHDPGAIRAAIAHEGGALVTGTRGVGFDSRGWFAKVSSDGTITSEAALESPNSTELFAVLPGRGDAELAIVGGYVDAQGWLVSLDSLDLAATPRWEKYIGSYGYTQVRGLVRLDEGQLLAIGVRGQQFGESWAALAPGDGGGTAAGDDVEQIKIEIAGADQNQMLRVIVDVGAAGYLAFGTAKRNHIQAHDQLLAVSFDRKGKLGWSRVVPEVRVTDVVAVRRVDDGATVLVVVPSSDASEAETALALVHTPSDPSKPSRARRLADSEGWTAVGFVDGSPNAELITAQRIESGLEWRRLAVQQ